MSNEWTIPFTSDEWGQVSEAARHVVNATFMDDAVLQASCVEALWDELTELEQRYGPYWLLTEVRADFTEDPGDRVRLYRQAREEAEQIGAPIHTIQRSLAEVLLDDFSDANGARAALDAGEKDLEREGDEFDRDEAHRVRKAILVRRSE